MRAGPPIHESFSHSIHGKSETGKVPLTLEEAMAKGVVRVALVSDLMAAGGMPPAVESRSICVTNAASGVGSGLPRSTKRSWRLRSDVPIDVAMRLGTRTDTPTFAPDADRLTKTMRRGGPANIPPAVPRTLATEVIHVVEAHRSRLAPPPDAPAPSTITFGDSRVG